MPESPSRGRGEGVAIRRRSGCHPEPTEVILSEAKDLLSQ